MEGKIIDWRRIILKTILFFVFVMGITRSYSQLKELESFGENPGNLRSNLYSPSELKDSVNCPLVVILHGCNQLAKQMHEQTGWKELADSNHFHLLYPEQRMINNPNFCFNWFNDSDIEKGKGEVESIHQMILKVSDSLNIDSTKIFIYGLSAGAAMSLAVMATYPDIINSGAVLAGGPYKSCENPLKAITSMKYPEKLTAEERGKKVKEQNPNYKGKYPRLILLHGGKDKVVDFENSLEIVKQWSYVTGVSDDHSILLDDYDGKPGFSRSENWNDKKEAVIIFYTLPKLGHTLAVDPGKGKKQGGKTGMFSKDVDLFSTWYIARDFGLIRNE
jgi:poly(hydroxyalkanoate) depolymerase family esterase